MMNQVKPKVSVCMPVYNGRAFIAESIASVLAQTYENFELLVIDNCSTDDTGAIVRGIKDPRIKYFRNDQNIGPIRNTNRCLELANGEYINIIHHDDIMLPDNLELKVGVLENNPEVGFVHSNLFMTDVDGNLLYQWNEDSRRDYVEDGLVVFHRYMNRMQLGALVFIGAVMARRACYEHLGGYRLDLLPHTYDNEMWLRMALYYKVGCVGKPLVTWRQHPVSQSSGWGTSIAWLEEHFLTIQIIFREYQNRIPDWKTLKKNVEESFGKEALERGINACGRDDFELGKKYFGLAEKYSKNAFFMKDYWRLALRLALGSKTARLYWSMKRKIAGLL